LTVLVVEVPHGGIRAREQPGHPPIVPAHDKGRRAVIAQDLEDLAVSRRLAKMVAVDYQAVARACAEDR
jgi:hypothetical protein